MTVGRMNITRERGLVWLHDWTAKDHVHHMTRSGHAWVCWECAARSYPLTAALLEALDVA